MQAPPSQPGRRLGEQWGFMSDHLPLGVTLTLGTASVRAASWNVLNTAYLRWIYKDEQGLNGSFITQHNVPGGAGPLTRREEAVVDAVLDLALGPNPRAVIGLQECSPAVRQAIVDGLANEGADFAVVAGSDRSEVVTLFDRRTLHAPSDLPALAEVPYGAGRGKTILPVLLAETATGRRFLFVNTHCPFGAASRVELATTAVALAKQHGGVPTVVVGDLNATSEQVSNAFATADQAADSSPSPFRWVPVCMPTSSLTWSPGVPHARQRVAALLRLRQRALLGGRQHRRGARVRRPGGGPAWPAGPRGQAEPVTTPRGFVQNIPSSSSDKCSAWPPPG